MGLSCSYVTSTLKLFFAMVNDSMMFIPSKNCAIDVDGRETNMTDYITDVASVSYDKTRSSH